VTLDNRSGATFRNVRLKLVAGDVHRVREDLGRRGYAGGAKAVMAMEAVPQFKESELFEYHLYALSRPTDVKNNQSKQVGLLAAEAVPVKKEYVFHGADHYYRARQTGEIVRNQKVPVFLLFRNDKVSRLGMPLPGEWKILDATHSHEKEDSATAVFPVKVDPDREVKLRYRVRIRY